jgi:NTP pyrophosphatase (non-canonical NTP hydrolase)
MRQVLKQAIETYGAEAQLNVAIEEFAELTKEICKHKRYADNTKAIIEEMADCYIMLEQMQMIFGLGSTVINDAMNKKIKRLKCRLDIRTPKNDEARE